MYARLKKTIRTSPPWAPERLAKAGTLVWAEKALNQPKLDFWITPTTAFQDWRQNAIGPYGVGAMSEDLEFLEVDD